MLGQLKFGDIEIDRNKFHYSQKIINIEKMMYM